MIRRRKKFFKPKRTHIIISVMMAALVLGVVVVCGVLSPVRQTTTFVVPSGASVASVADGLAAKNLVISKSVFMAMVRTTGKTIQRGEYDIPRRASAWRIARMLTRGDVATTTVVIPEGLTIKQIKQQLLARSDLSGPVNCDTGDTRMVCSIRDGEFFPDTYRVARGTSRLALLELGRKKMESIHNTWRRAGEHAPAPLKNWNDVVTLASIVQKETPRASEMPIVASVYLNRLRKKMRLQADPTVVYAITDGLGDMRGAPLLRGHLKTDSKYNTYTNGGLPPGPIANVGRAALRAVLNPADTNYLFFVADGNGGHRFSKSYDEHQKNHADWRVIKKVKNKK